MKKLLFLLLVVAILPVGCDDNSPSGTRTYDMDGEWEVWTAAAHNNCFMLNVGAAHFTALLESDANEEQYLFTGSDDGDRCWTREYVREGNELILIEVPDPLIDDPVEVIDGECWVWIQRERTAVFDSDDVFSETSTVTVWHAMGDGCPPDAFPNDVEGESVCEAEFQSLGVRCADCWKGCPAAAFVADPELEPSAVPGS